MATDTSTLAHGPAQRRWLHLGRRPGVAEVVDAPLTQVTPDKPPRLLVRFGIYEHLLPASELIRYIASVPAIKEVAQMTKTPAHCLRRRALP